MKKTDGNATVGTAPFSIIGRGRSPPNHLKKNSAEILKLDFLKIRSFSSVAARDWHNRGREFPRLRSISLYGGFGYEKRP